MTRTQYESEDIRHQIDQAKLRLTTDVKVKRKFRLGFSIY
jgi:hypothetical protein